MTNRTAWIVRCAAFLLAAGAVVNVALEAASLTRGEESGAYGIAHAIENTLPMLALSVLLFSVASISTQPAARNDDYAAERVAAGVEQLRTAMMVMQSQVNQLAADAGARGADIPAIDSILAKLSELRDFMLLDPQARQARIEQSRGARRTQTLLEARRATQQRRWADADEALKKLEVDFPGDTEIINLRLEYTSAVTEFENDAITRVRSQVHDLVSTGAWEEAHETVVRFLSQFPNNLAGKQLLSQLQNERSIADEETAQEIFEEIRTSVDSRQWRAALMSSDGFLERFPAHRRAEAIRQQLPTIQNNAEIEHRQESEAQIQELIRARRFSEAVRLADELIERYPQSPQASLLQQMLPKMREKATSPERSART